MKKPGRRLMRPDTLDLIEAYRDERLTLRDLAERYDVSIGTVRDWFSRAGISHLIRPQGSNPHALRRIERVRTDSDRYERLTRYHAWLDAGLTQSEIARREGITKQAVSNFLSRYVKENECEV